MVALSVQIEIAQGLSWARWKRIVAEVDRLGYLGLYCCDHFLPGASGYVDSAEIMTAFTYLADHSQRLEFGSLVAPVSFRDPVWLIRQAMALDDLSGGRFVLGVGAGWMEREHAMFGYELGDRATRAARLAEALEVMTLLSRHDEPVSFDGRFYHLREAKLLPHSPRPGGPRLLIGGSGPKRTLPLTARYADAWNAGGQSPAAFRENSARLDELIVKAGRQPGDVRRTLMQQVICYRDEADLGRRLRFPDDEGSGQSPGARLEALRGRSPNVIAGSPAAVIEQVQAYAAAGVEEIMVQRLDLDDIEGLQLIAEEVMPRVSSASSR
ncbi:MAG TPA: LLM class flavin-dependent oxidoreductase [Chloroflexota bacterium]|jgi:alkanesulfonate monooxygenase SsuD/methylene tetrahydromethanopterin reductase-like flavin-dependent oxidoreductase (luciferase family)